MYDTYESSSYYLKLFGREIYHTHNPKVELFHYLVKCLSTHPMSFPSCSTRHRSFVCSKKQLYCTARIVPQEWIQAVRRGLQSSFSVCDPFQREGESWNDLHSIPFQTLRERGGGRLRLSINILLLQKGHSQSYKETMS